VEKRILPGLGLRKENAKPAVAFFLNENGGGNNDYQEILTNTG
jgi:hypothetical protein